MPRRVGWMIFLVTVVVALSGCQSVGRGPVTETPTATMGEQSPLTVTVTLSDADVEYYLDNDTIRYPAAVERSSADGRPVEEEPLYSVIDFERWAESEAAILGAAELRETLEQRVSGDTDAVTVGVSTNGTARHLTVMYQIHKDSTGEVRSSPSVDYDEVPRNTPRNITATVTFKDKQRTVTFPVVVERLVIQET